VANRQLVGAYAMIFSPDYESVEAISHVQGRTDRGAAIPPHIPQAQRRIAVGKTTPRLLSAVRPSPVAQITTFL
jgi:hypothetical protein